MFRKFILLCGNFTENIFVFLQKYLLITSVIVIYFIILLPKLNSPAIWDGVSYFQKCILIAVNNNFSLFNYNCGSHLSFPFMFLVGSPQYILKGQVWATNFVIVILGLFATLSFYFSCRKLFNFKSNSIDLFFLTSLYTLNPPLIANMLNLNLDVGMLIWYTIIIFLLLKNEAFLTAVIGILFVFTKPHSFFIYTITTFSYFFLTFSKYKYRFALKAKKREFLLFSLPLLLYVLFFTIKLITTSNNYLWAGVDLGNALRVSLRVNPFSTMKRSYLAAIFLLNFRWVMTIFIMTWLIKIGMFLNYKDIRREVKPIWLVLIISFLGTLYLLIAYPTHTNPRYFLVILPVFLILFYSCFRQIIKNSVVRSLIMSFIVILNFLSIFKTVDPVSKFIWGVFSFGQHKMLRMTSVSGECCGYGRDQLAYNLEYLVIAKIKQKIYQFIRPNEQSVIVTHSLQEQFDIVDPVSYEILSSDNGINLSNTVTTLLLKDENKPTSVWYIQFPNVDDRQEFFNLQNTFDIKESWEFSEEGYAMKLYLLTLRNHKSS